MRILPPLQLLRWRFLGKHSRHAARTAGQHNPKAEELKRRTFKFALDVIAFCRSLRETWEGRELSDQLFRAGTRVGANYRAACRGLSHPDFVVKIGHVVEEADETCYWLDLIRVARITSDPVLDRLLGEAGELTAIFSQSQLTAKTNAGAYPRARKRGPILINPSIRKSSIVNYTVQSPCLKPLFSSYHRVSRSQPG